MITFLRDLFFKDFWLKLFSLTLAVLIWLTISFATKKEGSPVPSLGLTDERTFSGLPVMVVLSASDERNVRVRPGTVEVTVQGERKAIRDLREKDIRAIVDLTGIEAAHDLKKRIELSYPAGISLVHVVPEEVQVIFPPSS